jgi:PASTA domain
MRRNRLVALLVCAGLAAVLGLPAALGPVVSGWAAADGPSPRTPPVTTLGYPYTEIGVPQVVGLRVGEAERAIGRAGLHYTVRWRTGTGRARGVVLAQQPGGETVVGENAVVALSVSAGRFRHSNRS